MEVEDAGRSSIKINEIMQILHIRSATMKKGNKIFIKLLHL